MQRSICLRWGEGAPSCQPPLRLPRGLSEPASPQTRFMASSGVVPPRKRTAWRARYSPGRRGHPPTKTDRPEKKACAPSANTAECVSFAPPAPRPETVIGCEASVGFPAGETLKALPAGNASQRTETPQRRRRRGRRGAMPRRWQGKAGRGEGRPRGADGLWPKGWGWRSYA